MKRTILLADDSPTIRKVVELTFSDSEYRVEAVASGAEALESFDRLQPELVLADVVMPEPDGYEVCRRVKDSPHPVPVLLLAGTFEKFDAQQARSCRSDGHLKKPFESKVLVDRVRRLLEQPGLVGAPVHAGPPTSPRTMAEDPATDSRGAGAPPATVVAGLSPEDLDRVADAVLQRIGQDRIRSVVDECVPRLAERIIRERIAELEREDG